MYIRCVAKTIFRQLITEQPGINSVSNENNNKNFNSDGNALITEALNKDLILFDCNLT